MRNKYRMLDTPETVFIVILRPETHVARYMGFRKLRYLSRTGGWSMTYHDAAHFPIAKAVRVADALRDSETWPEAGIRLYAPRKPLICSRSTLLYTEKGVWCFACDAYAPWDGEGKYPTLQHKEAV